MQPQHPKPRKASRFCALCLPDGFKLPGRFMSSSISCLLLPHAIPRCMKTGHLTRSSAPANTQAAARVSATTETEAPSDFASTTGKGVTGKVAGRAVALGNAKLMTDQRIELGDLAGKADELRRQCATALFVGVDGKPGGIIAIADPIKATTRAALDSLRADGLHIVMLTGDNRTTAESVARQLGIDDIRNAPLPHRPPPQRRRGTRTRLPRRSRSLGCRWTHRLRSTRK